MSKKLILLLFLLFSIQSYAQDISGTNTDAILVAAQESYRSGEFTESLKLTRRGIELAPEYHDIRILQIRSLWALEDYTAADQDLFYLLKNAPEYTDVQPLAVQRLGRYSTKAEALAYVQKLERIYPEDLSLQVEKANLLLKSGKPYEARALADALFSRNISNEDRYLLRQILNQTISNEVGITYQYINFSEDYSRNESWNSLSAELQHNFGRTAVIGRANFSDRGYDSGTLYELEAYPVLNDRLYTFLNFGFSSGEVFPDYRASASLFYNFARILEAEIGGRMLFYEDSNFFSGIVGLSGYTGKFYLNVRSFIGPERMDQLVQNYQFNLRFYFLNVDNYLFLRLGSGISPDETALFSRIQQNPTLDAAYANVGIQKSLGVHHIFQLSAGFLQEEITSSREGIQFLGNLGYRYRF